LSHTAALFALVIFQIGTPPFFLSGAGFRLRSSSLCLHVTGIIGSNYLV
jgi:hypothetical protein